MRADVRRAGAGDAAALLPLIREHAAFERGVATIEGDALASILGETPVRVALWLAEMDGAPVGYAAATVDFATWRGRAYLHLDCLFVRAGHRGAGSGARLLRAVRRHAASLSLDEVQWQTPAWNDDARRFYLREGAAVSTKLRFRAGALRGPER